MKVYELTKEVGAINKEVIAILKQNGYKISSHNQTLTDEMIECVRKNYSVSETKEQMETQKPIIQEKKKVEVYMPKRFDPEELIACRSVTPNKLNAIGVDGTTVYHWANYGDVDYVKYKDLQSWRTTDYIRKPYIIVENEDICYQWRKDMGDTYKLFIDVEYPEEFFDKSDSEFEKLLNDAPNNIKDVIKVTAMNMIHNENYPTIQKLNIIDEKLGTCLKEFI